MKSTQWHGAAKLGLVLLVCGELFYNAYSASNNRAPVSASEVQQKAGYNDYSTDAVKYIHTLDQTFYRIDKDFSSGLAVHASINDAQIQGFKGTASYNSFNQKYYINFLSTMGLIDPKNEFQTRWAQGTVTRPVVQTICNVKYVLSKGSQNLLYWSQTGFDSLATFGNIHVLRSKISLPFGFTYSSFITERDFLTLSGAQKDQILVRACVLTPETQAQWSKAGFGVLTPNDTTAKFVLTAYQEQLMALRQDTLAITHQSNNRIAGTITLQNPKILYFSIPYDKGWKATVNGNPVALERVNIGFMGLMLDKGQHTIELKFTPPLLAEGAMVSGLGVVLYIGLVFWSWRKHRQHPANEQSSSSAVSQEA